LHSCPVTCFWSFLYILLNWWLLFCPPACIPAQ